MRSHVMERSGFAALSDLATQDWRGIYQIMEMAQSQFDRHAGKFRSPEYIWPADPLRTWSRAWEYPYVYHHLSRFAEDHSPSEPLRVADIGSGVTFFPFALSRLGCEVRCIDVDPVCERDMQAAIKVVPQGEGSVSFTRTDGRRFPLEDSSLDAVYSISVLEHIPHFEIIIEEIHRILKPSGRLVLTFDVDYRGDSELSVESFATAMAVLERRFEYATPERPIHPKDILDSRNSPFAPEIRPASATTSLLRALLGRKVKDPWHLAIYAASYVPRGK